MPVIPAAPELAFVLRASLTEAKAVPDTLADPLAVVVSCVTLASTTGTDRLPEGKTDDENVAALFGIDSVLDTMFVDNAFELEPEPGPGKFVAAGDILADMTFVFDPAADVGADNTVADSKSDALNVPLV